MSNFGSLFDTEVFQIKVTEDLNKRGQQAMLVFNYKI